MGSPLSAEGIYLFNNLATPLGRSYLEFVLHVSFLLLAWVNELSGSVLKLLFVVWSFWALLAWPWFVSFIFWVSKRGWRVFSFDSRANSWIAEVADSQSRQLCEFFHFVSWKLLKLEFLFFYIFCSFWKCVRPLCDWLLLLSFSCLLISILDLHLIGS